jgi:ribosomal protein S18 acetylase RimI-like enzyme
VRIEAKQDYSPIEAEAIEDRLYEYNRGAAGAHDGRTLGHVRRDSAGSIVGAAYGYSWAGISEIKQLWVDGRHRRQGYGKALLTAFVDEAASRGAKRIWLSTYDFQSPGLYEHAGFVRMAELTDWPLGHTNIVFCRDL